MKVKVIDTTLREGEQAPGVYFSMHNRWEIAERLIALGIDEIEGGIPVMSKEHYNFVTDLVCSRPEVNVSAWARYRLSDIVTTKKTGVEIIHISMPVSDYHTQGIRETWEDILHKFNHIINYAKDNFKTISLGIQDSFRAKESRITQICNLAEQYKIDRIRFSDTVGTAIPSKVSSFISYYRKQFSGEIDFHGHNDLGLATANSLSAIENGADSVNVTVNGLGERAGNASLEELAFILYLNEQYKTNIDLSQLKDLSAYVSNSINRPLPPDKPIVGENAFTHESGIHCHGIYNNPLAYQPFIPEEIGLGESKIVIGSHSGRSNLRMLLGEDIYIDDVASTILLKKFKKEAINKGSFLTKADILKFLQNTGN